MKEFCLLGVVTLLFALTFLFAGVSAYYFVEWPPIIGECGILGIADCFNISPVELFIGAVFRPIQALIIASLAWLVLYLGNVPRAFILPIWMVAFASVVAYLAYAGDQAVGTYIGSGLWILVSLPLTGYLYLYLVWHYRSR